MITKRLLPALSVAVFAFGILHSAFCGTITVANFDEDLATVYINGTAATNGEARVVADGAPVTLELRDFRSDW